MTRAKLWGVVPFLVVALTGVFACGDDDDSQATDAGTENDTGPNGEAGVGTAPSITAPPAGALAALVAGTAAAPVTFTASGTTPITWSAPAASLPPGMTLAANGTYSGTPTAAGDFTFAVTATNSSGTDTKTYTQKVELPAPDGHLLLTGNRIVAFSTKFPGAALTPTALTDFTTGDAIVAIDRRPFNGFLYGLGHNATNGTVTLYVLHPDTGVVVPVGAPQSFVDDTGAPLPVAGTYIGMDFNPAVDRVRVTTSTGQSFRLNPNTGVALDGNDAAGGVQMDGEINGGTTTVGEVAYTNNVAVPNAITTLYTIDVASDKLHIQNPPNAGTQASPVTLAKTIDAVLGFDIAPGVDAPSANAPVTAGVGYAVVKLTGQATETLVQINLATGAFASEAMIGNGSLGVIGLALQQPLGTQVVALDAAGTELVRFTSAAPAMTTTQAVTNLVAGEVLVGLDWRPSTGQLFGLGVNDAANTATLYMIDPASGAATTIGVASGISFTTAAAAPVDLPPASTGYGFDFNPEVDRIRVVTGSGLNFRLNPNNGTAVDGDANAAGTQPDGALNGGATTLEAVAYTNGGGAAVTTLYGLTASTSSLYIVNPPNTGTLTNALGIKVNGAALDFTAIAGFDMQASIAVATANAPATGSALAALTVGTTTGLYAIDLATGNATSLGNVGNGQTAIAGMTIAHTTMVK